MLAADQPRGIISTPLGECSLNFIFQDTAGKYYAGTAGHCLSGLGQTASTSGLGPIGTSKFRVASGVGTDFALIETLPSKYGNVNPAMRHWAGRPAPPTSPRG